jgi:hypothetical protein
MYQSRNRVPGMLGMMAAALAVSPRLMEGVELRAAKDEAPTTSGTVTPEPEPSHTVPCRQGKREMARRVRQMQKIAARKATPTP